MTVWKVCPVCGKKFERQYNAQKHCSAKCRTKYYAQKSVKDSYRPPKMYECAWCGKHFDTDRKRKYCCDECRVKANRNKPTRRKKPKLTLAEVNALARKEGLNYGQYVAKYGL